MKAAALAAAALLLASGASAQLPSDLGAILQQTGLPVGVSPAAVPAPAAPPPAAGTAVDEDGTPLTPDEQRTNFSYGEINDRLKKIVIGHGRRRRRGHRAPPQAPNNGVTPADRVDRGEINYIVIHSAMGTCEGAIDTMTRHHAAAHFIVCANGDVTRLVDIKNIALHVKNKDINAHSVGIETETGFNDGEEQFAPADWDPETRWRMYSSLAWLIRAVAEEAHVPRDGQHIIGHLQADLGIPGAHTDPGPMFYNQNYPAFDARFPGQNMTPQKFLMLLVQDDAPPVIEKAVTMTGQTVIRAREANHSGVARVKVYKLGGPKPVVLRSWEASAQGLPPFRLDTPAPTEAGDYRIEAWDLVGNKVSARFTIDAGVTGLANGGGGGGIKIMME